MRRQQPAARVPIAPRGALGCLKGGPRGNGPPQPGRVPLAALSGLAAVLLAPTHLHAQGHTLGRSSSPVLPLHTRARSCSAGQPLSVAARRPVGGGPTGSSLSSIARAGGLCLPGVLAARGCVPRQTGANGARRCSARRQCLKHSGREFCRCLCPAAACRALIARQRWGLRTAPSCPR